MRHSIILLILLCFASIRGTGQSLPKVKLITELGNIVVEVDTINAPLTANNFLNNVANDVYEGAVFYRVVRMDNQPLNKVKVEVIQGGIYGLDRYDQIPVIRHETTRETGLKHLNGTISMARMEPGTASTEFSICVGDQPELDFGGKRNPDGQGFAAFGQVLTGMDVVRKIQQQKDKEQYLVEKIKMLDVYILE